MDSSYFISFLDSKNCRIVSFDEPREVKILDGGAVRIKCADGFQTILKPEEWQKIEIERFDEEEADE